MSAWCAGRLAVAAALAGLCLGAAPPDPVARAETLANQARFDEAAALLEGFAARRPNEADAPGALARALTLRLALGDRARAEADVEQVARFYGQSQPAFMDRACLQLGQWLVGHDAPEAALGVLARAERLGGAAERVIERLARLTWQARACAALERRACRDSAYAEVRASAPAVAQDLAAGKGIDGEQLALLGRVLTELGEALLAEADDLRARDAASAAPPRYEGAGPGFDAFLAGPWRSFGAWRQGSLAQVEQAYLAVLALRPVPPPRAAVEAARKLASLWDDSAGAVLRAPFPAVLDRPARRKQRDAYQQEIARLVEPWLTRAKQQHEHCIALALKVQVFDANTAACLDWMRGRYPEELPAFEALPPPLQPALLPSMQVPRAEPLTGP
jgi:hypothetical protein